MKKSHKAASIIIFLILLAASLGMTGLYPRTGAVMENLRNRYEEEYREYTSGNWQYGIEDNIVNYAVEASYYMFGFVLQECENRAADFSVLDHYGWDSDYHLIIQECPYLAIYRDVIGVPEISRPAALETAEDAETLPKAMEPGMEESTVSDATSSQLIDSSGEYAVQDVVVAGSNEELLPLLEGELSREYIREMYEAGIMAYLILEYDAYGKLVVADMVTTSDNVRYYSENIYKKAKDSIRQYLNNMHVYQDMTQTTGDYYQVMPKNFKAVFLIHDESGFVYLEGSNPSYYFSNESLFWDTGVIFIIFALIALVAAAALILPFLKKLDTGWEKLFSIPFEIAVALSVGVGFCFYGMVILMAHTNMHEILREAEELGGIEFLGYALEPNVLYYILLAVNFLGWFLCFFTEYAVVASFRQFLSRPGYYLKHRILIVLIIRWLLKPIAKLYHYMTDIDVTEKLHKNILKIVILNFIMVSLCCCLWFAGIAASLVYSVVLYVLLKKYGGKLQRQYDEVISVTQKMAQGDLKVSVNRDLGILEPLGEELVKIQKGFSKAVAEEAKSQHMKTELITNVSHDLKTPLTAIITYVNLLKTPGISEEERQSYVETLDQKTQRLKILIEDLFEVSKANSGNIRMNFMDVDVVSLIKQVRLEMEDQLINSDLLFRWNLPDEKVILKLDGQRTYRVFVNLLSNILKYSMPGSRVFIDVHVLENKVQISFKNISLAELDFDVDRLTDRFVRGDEARNTEGSGLGLAIAKSFVELQNGTFKIDVDGDLFKATIIWPREC